MKIAGIERELPMFPINDKLQIAAFIMFGDVEITVAAAAALAEKAPEFDIIVTAESKGIPLAYELARISGKEYIVARKAPKLYMSGIVTAVVDSITTAGSQSLCLGSSDADKLSGKRVLIVDDVISTGESLAALEKLINTCGGSAGELSALALIAGFVYLLARKVIKPWITLSILGTVAIFALVYALVAQPAMGVGAFVAFHLLSGGLLLGSIFMATDYVTSPMSDWGGVVYGVGIGLLTMLIRCFGAYPEGVSFAILIMNMVVPLINKGFHQRKYGRA